MKTWTRSPMFDSPVISVVDVIASHGRFRGGRTAFICGDDRRSWRDFDANVSRIAAELTAAGLTRGERVALLAPNTIASVEALFGIMRAGGVATPLSAFLGGRALAAMLDDAGARFFISAAAYRELADEAAAAARDLPADACLSLDSEGGRWRRLGGKALPPPEPIAFGRRDAMNIIYSSGTTGMPKGIVHSHHSRLVSAQGLALEFRLDSAATTILATPIYTNGTWMTMLPTICVGGACLILDRYTPEAFLDAVEAHGATHAFLVPTQIRGVLTAQAERPRDISSIRMIVSAGSAIPQAWKQEALAALPGRLMELYGLTEGVATTLSAEDIARKPLSVGTPMPGMDFRILGDDDRELGPGEVGEIVGYGSGLMAGYHNRPEATEAVIWRDPRGRTFLRTGDIGRFDEDGFLYVLDRKKDMIVSGGVNVFASDIEQVLHDHPAVRDCAVVGEPHPKWVETPVAIVILDADGAVDVEEIRSWANARLGKHQQIHRVLRRAADFPRNALGKVLKRELRDALV